MNAKEWVSSNVNFRREESEVRPTKGYLATMAAAGLAVGVVTGIIIIILQFAVSNQDSLQTWTNGIATVAFLAMVAFLVYLLVPLFKSGDLAVGSKILTTLGAVASLIAGFVLGVAAVTLVFMVVAVLAILWLALKMWASSASSSSSSSYSAPRESSGPKQYKLDDGTTVTENSFTSGYHGNDGHSYERNIDDTFSRTD
ncbi:MAG: hypothetical protein IJ533_02810 [Prevotella sp.]|nr:hypothetical protein [Prevotella sp.]